MNELGVWVEDRWVGTLSRDNAGRMTFTYAASWLADGFPISTSLPLTGDLEPHSAHAFFANLLPEGGVRTAVCGRLGISEGNDFELLRAIGGECAGALRIGEEGEARANNYEPLSDAALAELNRSAAAASFAARDDVRLSLAGAQDKLPVYVSSGRIHIPVGNSPSSHILKVENRDFKHLPDNELLTTSVAAALDIPTADAALHILDDGTRLLLVKRYDRVVNERGELVRLHQEDLCQALGLPPFTKYEDEGGPSFARCLNLVRDHSHEPMVDVLSLIRWQVFNLIAGNCDGHAKNLSILYSPEGPRLAPAYDLVCTRAYPRLSRHLALAIGGERDPGLIGAHHWLALAGSIQVGSRLVRNTVREILDQIEPATGEAIRTLADRFGESPAGEMVAQALRKQVRRTRQLL